MKSSPVTLIACLILLVGTPASHAATVNLIGNDGLGTSSFNTGQNWAGGAAPSAANDYNTAGFQMRTPADTVSYTFQGASLTFGNHSSAGNGNGSLLDKLGGGATGTRTLTINNLTNLAGAIIRSGATANSVVTVAGNHYTIAGTSAIWADQTIWVISLPLLGADNVILTNFANNANDHVTFSGNNSGFTGSWYLQGGGNSAWSTELDALTALPGNPSAPNPGQITFINLGQLRDTVGCTYNNSNGGITLAANGIINASATTVIGVPITDLTNGVHSLASLTSSGTGTLVLSNANNNYAGGTIQNLGGTIKLGVDNAIPGNTIAGDVTMNGILDMGGHSATINGLSGSGTVDNTGAGAPALTIGANGDNGTFSGTIQNSSGALSLTKIGAGTETLSGTVSYSGTTLVAAGTLNIIGTATLPGDMIVSNGAFLSLNGASVNNLVVGTNTTLNLTASGTSPGVTASGSLTFQDNATNNFNYGTLTANPTAPAINAAGGISAPGTNIVIGITALGLKPGTFTLIKYTGTSLGSIANFSLNLPLGVVATLQNNTGNDSIDINVTVVPDNVAWNGASGTSWDLTTPNWTNLAGGGLIAFRQGDGVLFDDTLTNDFVNPQPTNINLTATFSVYPIPGLIVNSTLPYSFGGVGGITGPSPLIKLNTGSLLISTSNSFSGGVFINEGSVIITSDSALGASSVGVTLNGGTLQMNGNFTNNRAISMPTNSYINVGSADTVGLTGVISGGATSFQKADAGTLVLLAKETFTGNLFPHAGTVILDTGGSITNTSFDSIGVDTNDNATLTMRGTGALSTTSDFNVGDIGNAVGTLNVSGTASLTMNAFFIGSANAAGSTASGTVNQSGGTINQISTAVGSFAIGGRTSASGVGVYNMSGGTLNAGAGIRVGGTGAGTLNQSGGLINAAGGINIARIAGSFGTNNLNGGTLSAFNIATSTGTNAVFNFNGGTLQANFSPPSATWFSGNILANVQAGGAFIDTSNNNVTISTPLVAGTPSGGLTKKGTGTLTLSGVNTFTGPITNNAGTLFLNSASTYSGGAAVNAGTLQMTTSSSIPGSVIISNNAILTIIQAGSGTANLGDLTFTGASGVPGGTLALAPTLANNPTVPLVNCGTLTLNGTNSINLPVATLGTIALLKYTTLSGSGNCTNLLLPQGASGFISNYVAGSTFYGVITSTGPGIVWTGTNSAKPNLWDINTTTNWLLGSTPTSYHQVVVPGDTVTFNDSGSGTVILSNSVGPASLLISNSSKNYTFSGPGNITGPTGLQKSGTGTTVINFSNDTYTGSTVISNGTLQIGTASTLPSGGSVLVGTNGTLELAGITATIGELTGAGGADNNSGLDLVLTVGTAAGGTWNGSIRDAGHGGVALIKNGTGTWVVGGANRLGNGSPFINTNIFAAGTTIITNGGSFIVPTIQTGIGLGGSPATVIVAGGTLSVNREVLAVGFAGATGHLIVNSGGTVVHGGGPNGSFGAPNNFFVGQLGGTGTLTVNGGQVLNSQALVLGENATGNGTLNLNGGLVQTLDVQANGTPATSIANFNGGTLQAATNSGSFIQAGVTPNIMGNGLVLDDGGWEVTIGAVSLQSGDALGGSLVKQGVGAVYLDSVNNNFTGTTMVASGLLAGVGSVAGPVVVGPAGILGAGDAAGFGTFSLLSTPLTVQGTVAMRINKNSGVPNSDLLTGISAANYGGTLSVSNSTSDSTPLLAGDTFTLFSAATHSGNFGVVNGSPSPSLAYTFNPATGVLTVVSIASYPTNLTLVPSGGGSLTLSWPATHLYWIAQSNSVSIASPGNWHDIPGSQSGTSLLVAPGPGQPQVFYRLRHP
jgi:autotransporter-associated beta strand protein